MSALAPPRQERRPSNIAGVSESALSSMLGLNQRIPTPSAHEVERVRLLAARHCQDPKEYARVLEALNIPLEDTHDR